MSVAERCCLQQGSASAILIEETEEIPDHPFTSLGDFRQKIIVIVSVAQLERYTKLLGS